LESGFFGDSINPHKKPLILKKSRQLSQEDLSIVSPFFLSEKKELNQEYQRINDEKLKSLYFPRTKTRTFVDDMLNYEFPMHKSIDFLKRRHEGFLNKENLDLFKHFHRLFFKNRYYFDKKNEIMRKAMILINENRNKVLIFSETPLKLKKFIIEKNIFDIKIYEELLRKYEEEKELAISFQNSEILTFQQEEIKILDLNSGKLKLQIEHQIFLEENFLLSLLEKAENLGFSSISPKEIIEFKRIIEKRKKNLNFMKNSLELMEVKVNNSPNSLHFRTKTLTESTFLQKTEVFEETPLKIERNRSEIQEKLNNWKNMKGEGFEYMNMIDKSPDLAKERKTAYKFQSMLNKLKEKKKSRNPNEKIANIGKLVLRLESVKLNLLKRLNMQDLHVEYRNLEKIADSDEIFTKYMKNIVNTGNIITENEGLSENSRNYSEKEEILSKKQDFIKEIMPETGILNIERKDFHKKSQGKIAKFHRFSLAMPKDLENLKILPIKETKNELLMPITETDYEFFQDNYNIKSENPGFIENHIEKNYENPESPLNHQRKPIIISKEKPLMPIQSEISYNKPEIKEKSPKIEKNPQKIDKTGLKKRFSEQIQPKPQPIAKSMRKSLILNLKSSEKPKIEPRRDSKLRISEQITRKKTKSMPKPSKFARMSSSLQKSNEKKDSFEQKSPGKSGFEVENLNSWHISMNKEESPDIVLESFSKKNEENPQKIEISKKESTPQIRKRIITIKTKEVKKDENIEKTENSGKKIKKKRKSIEKPEEELLILIKKESFVENSLNSMKSIVIKSQNLDETPVVLEKLTPETLRNESIEIITPSFTSMRHERKPLNVKSLKKDKDLLEKHQDLVKIENISRPMSQSSIYINSPDLEKNNNANFTSRNTLIHQENSEKSIRYQSFHGSFENLDKAPISQLLDLNNIEALGKLIKTNIGSRKNIPFWEEDEKITKKAEMMNSKLFSIKIEEKKAKNSLQKPNFDENMIISKQNTFNLSGNIENPGNNSNFPSLLIEEDIVRNRGVSLKKKREDEEKKKEKDEGFLIEDEKNEKNDDLLEIKASNSLLIKKKKKKKSEIMYFFPIIL